LDDHVAPEFVETVTALKPPDAAIVCPSAEQQTDRQYVRLVCHHVMPPSIERRTEFSIPEATHVLASADNAAQIHCTAGAFVKVQSWALVTPCTPENNTNHA